MRKKKKKKKKKKKMMIMKKKMKKKKTHTHTKRNSTIKTTSTTTTTTRGEGEENPRKRASRNEADSLAQLVSYGGKPSKVKLGDDRVVGLKLINTDPPLLAGVARNWSTMVGR